MEVTIQSMIPSGTSFPYLSKMAGLVIYKPTFLVNIKALPFKVKVFPSLTEVYYLFPFILLVNSLFPFFILTSKVPLIKFNQLLYP